MRIVVILGRVLDPGGVVVNRRAGRIFINREEYILQPADRCALEMALRVKDEGDAEVVVLPRAPLSDDDVLRQALATGANRAVYVGGAANVPAHDDAVWTRVLVAALERLGGADLILLGATTLDTGQSQLGPRLAEALGWPQITDAWAAKVDGERVEVVRSVGGEYLAYEAGLPVLVTVVPGAVKLRYPDGAGLINIYKGVGEIVERLEQWDVSELVGEEKLKPLLERRGQDFPPQRERGVRASGTVEEMAQAAASALLQRVQR